mmetsp:Transcript_71697/g.180918  ORF Transcript_71697/g.180918 Transcript_71697/m.180918 type:complete len:253 (+) Transcript_71697:47-805(+)
MLHVEHVNRAGLTAGSMSDPAQVASSRKIRSPRRTPLYHWMFWPECSQKPASSAGTGVNPVQLVTMHAGPVISSSGGPTPRVPSTDRRLQKASLTHDSLANPTADDVDRAESTALAVRVEQLHSPDAAAPPCRCVSGGTTPRQLLPVPGRGRDRHNNSDTSKGTAPSTPQHGDRAAAVKGTRKTDIGGRPKLGFVCQLPTQSTASNSYQVQQRFQADSVGYDAVPTLDELRQEVQRERDAYVAWRFYASTHR